MQWLTPITAIYAAAVSVPLLLLLYFLKLKRREQIISSTLLWKRAVRDLQVNAPFQKLRRNILLLLQLLMLLAILFAIAGPILSMMAGRGRRFVLLIDRSASMNSTDVEPSRLEEAKKQAAIFIESLRNRSFFSLSDNSDMTMVIAFDNRSKVMCNYTSDKRQLIRAIESITPSDGASNLSEAVTVAQAFAQSPGLETDQAGKEKSAQLVLFSDGRIHDLDQIVIGTDELVYHSIGKSADNVAITAMQARRSYEKPEEIEVFATLANYGQSQVTCDVQLSINQNVQAVKSVTVPPHEGNQKSAESEPGKIAVNFSLVYADAGVLEVKYLQQDSLATDNAAWSILPVPEKLSVLLVSAGNVVLESALQACSLAKLEIMAPSKFDKLDHLALSAEQPYDVIILDSYVPAQLPKCRYLVFGRPPEGIDVSVERELENQVVVDWRQKHPVLKYVNLTNLFVSKCFQMDLPRDADVLAELNEASAMALVRRNGSTFLLTGFDVLQTNWPFEPGFVLFCYNAVNFLGIQVGRNQENNLRVNEPVVVDGLASDVVAGINGPGMQETEIKSSSIGSIRFPGTERVGLYSLNVPEQAVRLFAVNLLDSQESSIEPREKIVFSGESVEARDEAISRANLPLWPFLVGLALLLACLEWLVYNLKVKI